MITAIILVAIITAIFSILNRSLPFKICPICAGVSGSWLILTAGIVFGNWSGDYKLPIAMLMGGTVVGIAFQGSPSQIFDNSKTWEGKAKFAWAKRNIWFWKVPVVILGIPIAYWFLQNMSPAIFMVEIILLVLLIYTFFIKSSKSEGRKDSRHVGELEEKMKKCC